MRQSMTLEDLIFYLSVILCVGSIVSIDVDGTSLAYFTYFLSLGAIFHYLMRHKGATNG